MSLVGGWGPRLWKAFATMPQIWGSHLKAAESWSKGKGRGRKGAAEFVALIAQLQEEALHLEPSELVGLAAESSGMPLHCERKTPWRPDNDWKTWRNSRGRYRTMMLQEMEDGGELDPIDRLQAFGPCGVDGSGGLPRPR